MPNREGTHCLAAWCLAPYASLQDLVRRKQPFVSFSSTGLVPSKTTRLYTRMLLRSAHGHLSNKKHPSHVTHPKECSMIRARLCFNTPHDLHKQKILISLEFSSDIIAYFFDLFDSLAVCPLVVLTFYSCLVVTGQACPPCVRQLITDVIRWKPQACGAQPCAISLSSQTSSSFSPLTIIDLQKYP